MPDELKIYEPHAPPVDQASGLKASFIIITVVSLCIVVLLVLSIFCPHLCAWMESAGSATNLSFFARL